MLRARPVRGQRSEMRRARITFVAVESVLRVKCMQFDHAPVARDFREDRRGHDRWFDGIATDQSYCRAR